MAKNVAYEPKVGMRVYRPFEILKPGKIITVTPNVKDPWSTRCTVKWLDGSTTDEQASHLNNFTHAMEEHKKKYDKFSKIAQEVDKL